MSPTITNSHRDTDHRRCIYTYTVTISAFTDTRKANKRFPNGHNKYSYHLLSLIYISSFNSSLLLHNQPSTLYSHSFSFFFCKFSVMFFKRIPPLERSVHIECIIEFEAMSSDRMTRDSPTFTITRYPLVERDIYRVSGSRVYYFSLSLSHTSQRCELQTTTSTMACGFSYILLFAQKYPSCNLHIA